MLLVHKMSKDKEVENINTHAKAQMDANNGKVKIWKLPFSL